MPRFTTSDSVSLHYTDEGQGLPVLCLAGLTRDGHPRHPLYVSYAVLPQRWTGRYAPGTMANR